MSDLKQVTQLATKQQHLEQLVLAKEDELKALKNDLNQVKCIDLPELMEELGLVSFKLEDGSQISINQDLRGYVLEAEKYEVYNWLKANNYSSIIKASVTAAFDMKESEKADALLQELNEKGINATKKEDIHWRTFSKFIKECMEEGISLHEKIQIQFIKEAKIK